MDARELTKVYEQIRSEQQDMKRTVDYLEQEAAKLRRIVEDLKIDVQMLERRNRMGKLDDTISQVAYILDCLRALREIQKSGSCNDCKHSMECRFAPKTGGLVRYNCPYYVCRMEDDTDVQ